MCTIDPARRLAEQRSASRRSATSSRASPSTSSPIRGSAPRRTLRDDARREAHLGRPRDAPRARSARREHPEEPALPADVPRWPARRVHGDGEALRASPPTATTTSSSSTRRRPRTRSTSSSAPDRILDFLGNDAARASSRPRSARASSGSASPSSAAATSRRRSRASPGRRRSRTSATSCRASRACTTGSRSARPRCTRCCRSPTRRLRPRHLAEPGLDRRALAFHERLHASRCRSPASSRTA